LLYTPGVRIKIATAHNGVLDVSEDIVRGNLDVGENSVGTMNFTLANHRRKYDGVFTPNDRVTVQMKRISWVQVFSGYLNSVPFISVLPREVPLSASDTMKRLVYHYWDPGSSAAVQLLDTTGNRQGFMDQTDGGLRDRVMRLLVEVAAWPANNIHIGALPSRWFDQVAALQVALADRVLVDLDSLDGGGVVAGVTLASNQFTDKPAAVGPFTGVLPAVSGKVSWFGGPKGNAYGNMALSGESGRTPKDPWFLAMRFPYQGYVNGKITGFGTAAQRKASMDWWRNRNILIINQVNNKAIVVRAADWGPGGVKTADDRVADISEAALAALGATTDGTVQLAFANPSLPLGLVNIAGQKMPKADPLGETAPIVIAAGQNQALTSTPTGVQFSLRDQLQPNVAAARQFIQGAWAESAPGKQPIGGYRNSTIQGTNTKSDHSTGRALDVMNGSKTISPNAAQAAHSTSVAAWFLSNPNVFGTKYVIWYNKINFGQGWQTYFNDRYRNDPNLGHYNHVHISFIDNGPKSLGPMGSPMRGADMAGFPGQGVEYAGTPTGANPGTAAPPSGNLINSYLWTNPTTVLGQTLGGIRALMNDVPLYDSVQNLTNASMRSMMAGPNGDFIAWFPDYFGGYGTAGKINIKDIELAGDGFTLTWSDARLKTHMYVTGSWYGGNDSGGIGGPVEWSRKYQTAGIANVEYPEIMRMLFNIDPADPRAAEMLDSAAILNRYGARPEDVSMGEISGAKAEFWMAIYLFQQNWAKQWTASISLTFMPEIYPGMLLVLESYGLQVYVTSVSHSFDFQGGFFTSVTVIAPASTKTSGLFGLPKAAQ